MGDDRSLEQALQDIEADVRVLTLIDEAQPDNSGWALYNLPREEGFELLRIPVRDQYVSIAAMCRLKASIEKALDEFYKESPVPGPLARAPIHLTAERSL